MSECERCELELSAAIDGVIDPESLLPALDHLVQCTACGEFYRGGRRIEAAVGHAKAGPPPERVWSRIEEACATPPLPLTARPTVRWTLRAAAVVAIGFGLWATGALRLPGAARPPAALEVQLEGDRDAMDDERFVRLTAELLRADRRYHRKMMDVLAVVNRHTLVQEGADDPPEQRLRARLAGGTEGEGEGERAPATLYW